MEVKEMARMGGLSSAAKRFMGMTPFQKSEYMKAVRAKRSTEKSIGDIAIEALKKIKK